MAKKKAENKKKSKSAKKTGTSRKKKPVPAARKKTKKSKPKNKKKSTKTAKKKAKKRPARKAVKKASKIKAEIVERLSAASEKAAQKDTNRKKGASTRTSPSKAAGSSTPKAAPAAKTDASGGQAGTATPDAGRTPATRARKATAAKAKKKTAAKAKQVATSVTVEAVVRKSAKNAEKATSKALDSSSRATSLPAGGGKRKRAPVARPSVARRAARPAKIREKGKEAALPVKPAPSSVERPDWDHPHDGHEPAPSSVIDRGREVPETYGCDRLVAVPRDPQWAFCYWELTGGMMDDLRDERGHDLVEACAWALRLHRIDEDMAVDMEIEAAVGNWYVHVVKPGRYQFELGLLTPEGEFVSLLASHVIETPAEGPSDVFDEEWRLRAEDEKRLHEMLLEALGMDPDGTGRGTSGFLGASVLPSSWRLPFSFMGASWGGSLSGRPVAGSWAWSFQGASGMLPSSPGGLSSPGGMGSDTLGWLVGMDGRHQPVLLRPTRDGGPNWNLQPYLPGGKAMKSHAPHFKVKLPRVLRGVRRPKPSWPPEGARTVAGPKRAVKKAGAKS